MAKTPSPSRTTFARIDKNHFCDNLRYLRSLTNGSSFFCPMLKADAYGHGDIELSHVCDQEKVSAIGLDSLEEAIRLRENQVKSPLLVFGPYFTDVSQEFENYQLTAVISDWKQIEIFQKSKTAKAQKIHLKFNSGMNRKGFQENDVEKLLKTLASSPHLKLEGVLTHLLNGEDILEDGYSKQQLIRFEKLVQPFQQYKPIQHIFNTSATVMSGQLKDKITLGVRPGIGLFGYSSLKKNLILPLKPVMEIHSSICNMQKVRKGEVVSYGANWKASRDSWIAVIPLGYADGYLRSFSNRAHMLVRGKKAPVVGTVCMDYCMIDVTDLKAQGLDVGEPVVVLGRQGDLQIHAEDLAQIAQTISYEVLTAVGARIPRIYMENK